MAYYGSSPFGFGGGGFYFGPLFGVGVGGSTLFLILTGVAAFILVSGFLSDRTEDGLLTATEKTSVIKLQVWSYYFLLIGLIYEFARFVLWGSCMFLQCIHVLSG